MSPTYTVELAWLTGGKGREIRVFYDWNQGRTPKTPGLSGILIDIWSGFGHDWLEIETPGEYATERVFINASGIGQIEIVRPIEPDETSASIGEPPCTVCGKSAFQHPNTDCEEFQEESKSVESSNIYRWFYSLETIIKGWHVISPDSQPNSACGKARHLKSEKLYEKPVDEETICFQCKQSVESSNTDDLGKWKPNPTPPTPHKYIPDVCDYCHWIDDHKPDCPKGESSVR